MDIESVRAALAHDPRFGPLLDYLAERFGETAPPPAAEIAEVVDSAARSGSDPQPLDTIERVEADVADFVGRQEHSVAQFIGRAFGPDDPEPGAA